MFLCKATPEQKCLNGILTFTLEELFYTMHSEKVGYSFASDRQTFGHCMYAPVAVFPETSLPL